MKFFSTKNIILIVIVALVFAVAAFFLFDSNDSPSKSYERIVAKSKDIEGKYESFDSEVLEVSDSEFSLGSKDAKVTFIDYASMSCPHCAAFYDEAFEELKEEYIDTGKVRFVYRDFPLNQPSLLVAGIAVCVANNEDLDDRTESYHEFVEMIYDTQNSWVFKEDFVAKIDSIAVLEGFDKGVVTKCSKTTEKIQEKILRARMMAAKELDIQSTPTFFINDKKIQGFVGYQKIKELIEYELNK